jgi:hypothetical protein
VRDRHFANGPRPASLPRLWEQIHGPAGARDRVRLRRDGAALELVLVLASYG